MASSQAFLQGKRLYNAKKAGHPGSLDPLGTGMLPLCFGEATKFSQFLLDSDKQYEVYAKLGIKTTTGDAEGAVVEQKSYHHVTSEGIMTALKELTGTIQQIPPMYSAVKYHGKALYTFARKGIEVPRAPRPITIYELSYLGLNNDLLHLKIHCSKGTYVRTLIEEIGEKLNCGAHVHFLHRTFVSPYQNNTMLDFDALEKEAKASFLLPIKTSVQSLPEITLSTSLIFYLRMGQSVMMPGLPSSGLVSLLSQQGQFLGVGEVQADRRLSPKRLLQKETK